MHKNEMIINRNFCDINPRFVGSEDCDPMHSYGPAVREYYLIHYVVRGKGRFCCKGREYRPSAGDLFMTAPGEVMYYEADEQQPWSYIWVGFETAMEIDDIFSRHVIHAPECGRLFQEMVLCGRYGEKAEMYLCSKLFELMARLGREEPNVDSATRYALQAKNLIETHYDSDLSVASLAGSLGLDRSYFSKIFRESLGTSPQQYIVSFRLQKAAELMREHRHTPSQAAGYCGYRDVFNFSKMFKKLYGISPRKYYDQYK